jgi:hypothetical protein
MYVDKSQWFQFILCGIITVVGYNIGLAIRDTKSINQEPQIEQPVYKQLPVIPFTNSTS